MYNAENIQSILENLRDFFYFGTQDTMKQAYEEICRINGDEPSATDWVDEEYCFNRLFVGPKTPTAPMLASYYLETDSSYNGHITKCVKTLYRTIGLELPENIHMPEDSLPFELDACRYLQKLAEVTQEASAISGYFIKNHMNEWVHLFLFRTEQEEKTPAVEYMLFILKRWMTSAVAELAAQEV
jgi:TorA maturation chaperone TorD